MRVPLERSFDLMRSPVGCDTDYVSIPVPISSGYFRDLVNIQGAVVNASFVWGYHLKSLSFLRARIQVSFN